MSTVAEARSPSRLAGQILSFEPISRRVLKKAVVAFLYHEVSDRPSVFNRLFNLNVRPAAFSMHLDLIRQYFHILDPLELVRGDYPRPAAVITFDDGNLSYFREALPILRAKGIPSVVFLNMGPILGEVCWSGLVTYLQHFEPGFARRRPRHPSGTDFCRFTQKEVADYLGSVDREQLFRRVREFRGAFASLEDLRGAAGDPPVYLGNHLYNHWNATLLTDDLEEAFRKNQKILDDLPRRTRLMSYPFSLYTRATNQALLRAGAQVMLIGGGLPNFHTSGAPFHRVELSESVRTEEGMIAAVLRNLLSATYRRQWSPRYAADLPRLRESVGTTAPARMERLAAAVREVQRRCPDLAVQATLWLHLKHPIHPVQEEMLQELDTLRENPSSGMLRRGLAAGSHLVSLALRLCLCLLYSINLSLRLCFFRFRLRRPMGVLKSRTFGIVAKTWCFDDSLLAGDQDFYYGNLQRRLAGKGVSILFLNGNPRGMSWWNFARTQAALSNPQQMPEFCLAPVLAPLRFVPQQLRTSVRLMKMALQSRDGFLRRLALRASRDSLSPRVTPIGLYYWMGKAIVRTWRPKAVVTLYEGHAWEQCLWRGVKEEDPGCKIVGYQHTILLPHNRVLLEPQEQWPSRLRPDVVLCLGPRTEAMLRSGHTRSDLFPFGTFRRLPATPAHGTPAPERKTVLVLPEGYIGESALLFNAALRAARELPDHRFILRTHPVLSFEEVRPKLEADPSELPNVRISKGHPIEHDFAESSVALYRGSSSVFYAISYGLKPVFLQDERLMEPDPLFELTQWRDRACSVQELIERLRGYAAGDRQEAAAQWRPAAEYVASYTVPVGDRSIRRLLDSVGIP